MKNKITILYGQLDTKLLAGRGIKNRVGRLKTVGWQPCACIASEHGVQLTLNTTDIVGALCDRLLGGLPCSNSWMMCGNIGIFIRSFRK